MTQQWIHAVLFIGLACAIALGTLFAAWLVRVVPRSIPPTRRDTYECGEEPEGLAWIRFHPRYFIVALVFVLFDAEAAFLIPWSVALQIPELSWLGLIDMGIFLGVLFLGWIYALKKGALEWH